MRLASFVRRRLLRSGCAVAAIAMLPGLVAAADPATEDGPAWAQVRKSLFKDRAIETDADGTIVLEAPVRAEDAATVPIAIRTRVAESPSRAVRKVWLIIDRNPSPIAAVFTFSSLSGRADIETRVRIEEYTTIRAIAETGDGKLTMATRWIKASGGCSAPAGKDAAAALASLGRMKLRIDEPAVVGRPVQAQLMISHPNSSGLAMDQVTRLYEPPYFVRRVTVSYAGQPVLEADVDFSISENPNFRFFFVPDREGELKAEVVDSRDLTFENRLVIRPRSAAGS